MSFLIGALSVVFAFGLVIFVHEFGHFIVAKKSGVKVERFSFGLGPPLWRRQIVETTWQVAVLPLGGFVQVQGVAPAELDGEGVPDDGRSFRARPRWQRALFLFAGPAANWLLAAFFIFLLLSTVGFEQYDPDTTVIGEVIAGAPAEVGGLLPDDQVVAVGGVVISSWPEIVAAVTPHPDEELTLSILRAGAPLELKVHTRKNERGDGEIGVAPKGEILRMSPGRALVAGFVGAWEVTADQARVIWGLVNRTEKGQLSGLPGIVKMVSTQAHRGLRYLLQALAYLSVSLAFLNLLPIPALDGSRLLFVGIEGVRRRPLNAKAEAIVHGIGFLVLMALIIVISIRDLL